MSGVKLLGNVAQRTDALLTALVEGGAGIPDGYDCNADHDVLDYFNPVSSVKYLLHCGTAGEGFNRMLAFGLDALAVLLGISNVIRLVPKRTVSERPAAEGKKELISVEDEKVIEALIKDLTDRPIVDDSAESNLQKVVLLAKSGIVNAVESLDRGASLYEFDKMPLFQAQARLLGAYYAIKSQNIPLSDVTARLLLARQLFDKAKSATTTSEEVKTIDELGRIAGRTLYKTIEEDLRPIPILDKATGRFGLIVSTVEELSRRTPPQNDILARLNKTTPLEAILLEYERFKEEGGLEAVLDKIEATTKADQPTKPSYYDEWTRVKTANDEATRIGIECGGDFRELQKKAESITSKPLNETKDWDLAAALYLKASSVKGINDIHKSSLLIGAGDSLSNAGRFTEARRHFESVLNMFIGTQYGAMSTESTNVSYAKSGIDKITVITGQGLGEEAAKIASLHDMRALFVMEGNRKESIHSVYTRINKVPPIEVVDSLARISLRWAELAEGSNDPSFNLQRAYEVVIECYGTYGHGDSAVIKGLPDRPGNRAQAAIERLQAASAAAPGVLRGGVHESTGPKIDPDLVRKAAGGASWAIKQLLKETRKIDSGMTVARLAKMIRSNTPKDVQTIESFGLAGFEKPLLDQLATTLGSGDRRGAHGKDEDRRGKNGPYGR